MKKTALRVAVACALVAALVFGFFAVRKAGYNYGKEQGYLVGYSIGYADQIGGKTQASQSLAGSLNPYRYGNARWKGFMMGFPAGYEEGLTAETAG